MKENTGVMSRRNYHDLHVKGGLDEFLWTSIGLLGFQQKRSRDKMKLKWLDDSRDSIGMDRLQAVVKKGDLDAVAKEMEWRLDDPRFGADNYRGKASFPVLF